MHFEQDAQHKYNQLNGVIMNSNALKVAVFLASSFAVSAPYAAVTFLGGAAVDISETGIVAGNYQQKIRNGSILQGYVFDAGTKKFNYSFFETHGIDDWCETSITALSSNGAAGVGTIFHDKMAKIWPNPSNYNNGVARTTNTVTGINNSRDVAGFSIQDNGRTVANKWTVSGELPKRGESYNDYTTWAGAQLYTPATGSSKSVDINNAGVVVGQTTDNGNTVATVWNGVNATYLVNPNGGTSFASSINDAGQVVGTAGGYATLWADGGATTLGIGQALSISGNGLIAGYSFTQDNNQFAALWNNGETIDLNSYLSDAERSSGWLLTEASGVNSQGYVVGKAINMNTGAVAGFVTPVPEPETYALMMGGLGLVGAAVRRKRAIA